MNNSDLFPLDVVDEFFFSFKEEVTANQALSKAIRYALSHKGAMFEYLNDGQLNIDNNPAERALRCVAIGRKNMTRFWLWLTVEIEVNLKL